MDNGTFNDTEFVSSSFEFVYECFYFFRYNERGETLENVHTDIPHGKGFTNITRQPQIQQDSLWNESHSFELCENDRTKFSYHQNR